MSVTSCVSNEAGLPTTPMLRCSRILGAASTGAALEAGAADALAAPLPEPPQPAIRPAAIKQHRNRESIFLVFILIPPTCLFFGRGLCSPCALHVYNKQIPCQFDTVSKKLMIRRGLPAADAAGRGAGSAMSAIFAVSPRNNCKPLTELISVFHRSYSCSL